MENTSLLIKYGVDPEHKLLYSKWAGDFTSAQYRASITFLTEVIKANRIQLWLHETIKLQSMPLEDQIWTVEVFALDLAQSDLKHIAIVRPEITEAIRIGKAMKDRAYRIFGRLVGVEFFETIEEAKAWLIPSRQFYKLPAVKEATVDKK